MYYMCVCVYIYIYKYNTCKCVFLDPTFFFHINAFSGEVSLSFFKIFHS